MKVINTLNIAKLRHLRCSLWSKSKKGITELGVTLNYHRPKTNAIRKPLSAFLREGQGFSPEQYIKTRHSTGLMFNVGRAIDPILLNFYNFSLILADLKIPV